MNLNDYQNDARKTAVWPTWEHMAFGLLEEAGEIAGICKRYHRADEEYDSIDENHDSDLSEFAKDRLKAELGDVLWYAAMLADVLGFTLEEVAKGNLAKLQRRKAKDMIHGSGDDR
jgi:NTP pyrophosphatase (non-canonical NTP hydrolase)